MMARLELRTQGSRRGGQSPWSCRGTLVPQPGPFDLQHSIAQVSAMAGGPGHVSHLGAEALTPSVVNGLARAAETAMAGSHAARLEKVRGRSKPQP